MQCVGLEHQRNIAECPLTHYAKMQAWASLTAFALGSLGSPGHTQGICFPFYCPLQLRETTPNEAEMAGYVIWSHLL